MVLVEHRESVSSAVAAEAGDQLMRLVKNSIGVSVAVDVVPPNIVERSVGKMRRLLDIRPQQ